MKAPPRTFEQLWSIRGGAYGGYNRTEGDPSGLGTHDLSARAGGFAGALDYHLSHDTVIGVALAGGDTNWGLADGLGSGRSNALQAGLYGKTRSGPAYLAGSLAYTWHAVGTDRLVLAGDQLSARFNAESFGGRLEGGYRLAWPVAAVIPYAAVQAQSFSTPSYSETDLGGGGFGLAFAARTATDTRSELGTRFERVVAVDPRFALALKARLAWAHDWVSDPTLAATFETLPGASFTVNGAAPAKELGAGHRRRGAAPPQRGVGARQARRRVREPCQHLCGQRRHSLRLVKRYAGGEPPAAADRASRGDGQTPLPAEHGMWAGRGRAPAIRGPAPIRSRRPCGTPGTIRHEIE